jgi:deoxyribodipyrimidine photo-lyase
MKTLSETYGLHWFRRDLRIAGNPALQWSWKQHQGRVLGVFSFDKKFLSRPDFSHNRFGFFLRTLHALRTELRHQGGDLLVLDTGPDEAFRLLHERLSAAGVALPKTVSFNRDYEPFARERDSRVSALLASLGITVHSERDHLLIEPEEILKDADGGTYQVYSPFAKRWFERLQSSEVQARIALQRKGLQYLDSDSSNVSVEPLFRLRWADLFSSITPPEDHLDSYIEENQKHLTISLPDAGTRAALATLRAFKKERLQDYAEQRDFPGVTGTSQLSIYLKNGSLTTTQIMAELGTSKANFKEKNGPTTYLKELAWREFYYYILFHHPRVEHQAFLQKFQNLEWENRDNYFEAWKTGRTGYPIVDAGMRQLNQTGWMHNRVRMIVASFLTKDLLISWQWGERYFMEKLLDGDLAPNNGGWQWAASTGCDPQPYFRIFNPLLQSQKFDPTGSYIRTFVPELRTLSDSEIHEPHQSGKKIDYPAPIVDHQEQKEKALELYEV